MSKYGVFSCPYFPAFGMNNTDQKKLRIRTLFTQCVFHIFSHFQMILQEKRLLYSRERLMIINWKEMKKVFTCYALIIPAHIFSVMWFSFCVLWMGPQEFSVFSLTKGIKVKFSSKCSSKNLDVRVDQKLALVYQTQVKEWNLINPLQPSVAFLYPLKTSENRKVFWCFQGV